MDTNDTMKAYKLMGMDVMKRPTLEQLAKQPIQGTGPCHSTEWEKAVEQDESQG